MARDLHASVVIALGTDQWRPAVLAEFDFVGGYVRFWTGFGDLTWDSKTWTGVGDFAGISPIEESTNLNARGAAFNLSGIPSSTLSLALTEKFRGRRAKSWLAFLDPSLAVIGTPYQWFGGRMDTMTIDRAGSSLTVTVACENRLIDQRRARSSRYTAAEQESRFPGDLGCEYVARLSERPLPWGVPQASAASGGGYSPKIPTSSFVR